jgi:hypothetical protein
MSAYNPGASTAGAAQSPTPDTQTLIGLLGNLMPLLLQIQSQSRWQMLQGGPFQPDSFVDPAAQPGSFQPGFWQPGLYQSAAAPVSGPQPVSGPMSGRPNSDPIGNIAAGGPRPADPVLDQQAAVNLVEDITADSLRLLSAYLETYAGQHQGLESCVPIVTQAARCFAARDFAQTLGLIWQAYRVITALRAGNPQLPPPRVAGLAGAPFRSATPIIH